MKKFIIGVICIILVGLVGCQTTKAQTVKREGKTFIAESNRGASTEDIPTTFTWRDNKGVEHPIYLHKFTKGEKQGQWGAYVIRKSAKTGNDYKYYFPNNEVVAKEIQKEI